MKENDTETNWDTLEEVIYEWTYDISLFVIEDCVNEKLGDSNKNYLIEENEIEAHDEEGE